MLKLIKRFTINELLNHNKSICNPSILLDHNIIIYRDGRTENKICTVDDSKLLKMGKIDNNFNVADINTISIKDKVLSDPRLFKWNNEVYIAVTIINYGAHRYPNMIDIYDLKNNQLLNIFYNKAVAMEKNWIFFQDPYSDSLLCCYSIWNNYNKILKLYDNELKDEANTYYSTNWDSKFGNIRNTSNLYHYNNLMWGCLHSHNYPTIPVSYRMGIYAFEDKYPYNIIYMSNVPLFNIKYNGQWFYPTHLDIKDDIFRIGVGFYDFDHFDLITLDMDDIKNHLNNNISYDYAP